MTAVLSTSQLPALCALCDRPEGDTEWGRFVAFRGTVAHAGCSLDFDSDMADSYMAAGR